MLSGAGGALHAQGPNEPCAVQILLCLRLEVFRAVHRGGKGRSTGPLICKRQADDGHSADKGHCTQQRMKQIYAGEKHWNPG